MPRILWGLLLIVSVISAEEAMSQDMIVRIYGDTIHGKIDREDERFVYYRTLKTKRGEEEIISRKEVSEILYGMDDQAKSVPPPKTEKRFEVIQATIHAGYSRILNTDDLYGEDFQDLYDDMRGGVFIDGRLNVFFNDEIGLGFLYSRSNYDADSEAMVVATLPSGNMLTGELGHDRRVNYFALNLAYRVSKPLSNFNLQLDVGLGYLNFEDKGEFIGGYTLTSGALGMHLSGSFHLGLGEGFYLPAYISLKGFSLSQFDFEASAEMDPELAQGLEALYDNLEAGITMTRFEIGLGLGFSF